MFRSCSWMAAKRSSKCLLTWSSSSRPSHCSPRWRSIVPTEIRVPVTFDVKLWSLIMELRDYLTGAVISYLQLGGDTTDLWLDPLSLGHEGSEPRRWTRSSGECYVPPTYPISVGQSLCNPPSCQEQGLWQILIWKKVLKCTNSLPTFLMSWDMMMESLDEYVVKIVQQFVIIPITLPQDPSYTDHEPFLCNPSLNKLETVQDGSSLVWNPDFLFKIGSCLHKCLNWPI